MSERTTIGGTVYEAIGSSSSNLLLKCNGTARIQWGGKLIDLIKNGKIASEGSQELIFIIKDESEIKSDGIYVLTTEESDQLWISKDGNKYDFTGTDLYISASKPQNLTSDQKKQALDNIGMYYNTLDELQQAGIQNGIVYIIEEKALYTIKDGSIEEFEAKVKTIAVDKEIEGMEVINSSVKIVLSILDSEYLILADQRITANYSVHIKNSAQLGSENADKNHGYRLYIDGNTSYLDVDEINVRNGFEIKLYKEVSFEEFIQLLDSNSLEPHNWYLINDYQNPWKLVIGDALSNRPILVRALTASSIYDKGYLFKDHRIEIKYNPYYQEHIEQTSETDEGLVTQTITARGRIEWMRDTFNNEANFDFLDYTDANRKPLTTLHKHPTNPDFDKSIFPTNSHDNKLTAYRLKGTVFKNGKIDEENVSSINFQVDEISGGSINMYNNEISCRGLLVRDSCANFYNNKIKRAVNIDIYSDFVGNDIDILYKHELLENINFSLTSFEELIVNKYFTYTSFSLPIYNFKCEEVRHCVFVSSINDCYFGNVENSKFNAPIDKFTLLKVERPTPEYIYEFQKVTNTIINTITNQATFRGELVGCYINSISDSSTIGNYTIVNSTFNDIKASTIDNNISNSTFNDIVGSEIKKEITDSTFEDIDGTNFNGIINKSEFKKIQDSEINAFISNSKIQEINKSTLEGEINNSSIGNITDSVLSSKITNNTIGNITNLSELNYDIVNSNIEDINNSIIDNTITNSNFKTLTDTRINGSIIQSDFLNIHNITLNASFNNVKFKNLQGGIVEEGTISDTISYYDLFDLTFSEKSQNLLYNTTKHKEIYIHYGKVYITCIPDVVFYRGMIIMHSGAEEIPLGWALCDGEEYEFDGKKIRTPDLRNRFIKATNTISVNEVKASEKNDDLNDDGTLTLKEHHLPEHSHPHAEHTHEMSTTKSQTENASTIDLDSTVQIYKSKNHEDGGTYLGAFYRYSQNTVDHLHDFYVEGSIDGATSQETAKTWENKSINITPDYYSLIFIMKL